jgi:hypothetical protein
VKTILPAVAILLGSSWTASADPPVCAGDPLFITNECADPRFNNPVIDLVEERTDPLPHTYMHGFWSSTRDASSSRPTSSRATRTSREVGPEEVWRAT